MYTTRHFQSVAAILKNFRDEFAGTPEGAKAYGFLVRRFSLTFRLHNKIFDEKLFKEACGYTEFIDKGFEQMMEKERDREFTT